MGSNNNDQTVADELQIDNLIVMEENFLNEVMYLLNSHTNHNFTEVIPKNLTNTGTPACGSSEEDYSLIESYSIMCLSCQEGGPPCNGLHDYGSENGEGYDDVRDDQVLYENDVNCDTYFDEATVEEFEHEIEPEFVDHKNPTQAQPTKNRILRGVESVCPEGTGIRPPRQNLTQHKSADDEEPLCR